MIVEAIKYTDILGSRRYVLIIAAPAGDSFKLLVFDPGPPGADEVVIKHINKIDKYIRRTLGSKISEAFILLTHTHPTSAGASGYVCDFLKKKYGNCKLFAHIRSLPLIEKNKSPEFRVSYRFERNTTKRLRIFKEHSPPIYRPYYVRILSRTKLPEIEPLVPKKWSPKDAIGERMPLEIDVDIKLEWMRSAGHSYEHVVYRFKTDDFYGLFIGDEGPAIFDIIYIRYNDTTSRQLAVPYLKKRQESFFEETDEPWIFRSHGAMKPNKLDRISAVDNFLNNLNTSLSSGLESLEESARIRMSDSAAAMLIRDFFLEKYPRLINYSKFGKTHYVNAENLPIFTARSALLYMDGNVISGGKIIRTRSIDLLGKDRYIEIL